MSYFKTELQKVLFKRKGTLVIAIYAVISILILLTTSSGINFSIEQNQDVYNAYMSRLQGPISPEKERFLLNEKTKFETADAQNNKALEDYLSGRIDELEFIETTNQNNKILKSKTVFNIIWEQYQYVDKHPDERYFIPVNGISAFVSLYKDRLDLVYYLLLLILITPIFCEEYESGIYPLLMSCKKGRYGLAKAKMYTAFSATGISFLVSSSIKWLCCFGRYPPCPLSYPIQSLDVFEASPFQSSFMSLILFAFSIELIGSILFACMITLVSNLCKQTLPALFVSFSTILIPSILFHNTPLKILIPSPAAFTQPLELFTGSYRETISASFYQVLPWLLCACGILISFLLFITSIRIFSFKRSKV